MHSHLIPAIDDGVKSNEESFAVIRQLQELGYSRIITTPHIMTDYYGNSAESVRKAYENFLPALRSKGLGIDFQFAAEYYLDETVIRMAETREQFLTFGDRFLLFETNAISEPMQLKEFVFGLTSQGYKPVLAHPERYQYMTLAKAEDLINRGVFLQVNLLSLIGYYGPPIQKLAEKLIEKKWVSLLGSDCHNMDHAMLLKKVQKTKAYQRALELPLLNFTI
jgi:protein-tyrosine phosphatase